MTKLSNLKQKMEQRRWEADSSSATLKFPTFYGTVFTAAPYMFFVVSQINPIHDLRLYFLNTRLILSSPLRLGLSKWSSFTFPPQTLYVYLCHMPHPCHAPCSDDPTSVWWAIQLMKLLMMLFAAVSCCFLLLRVKCVPKHPTVQHLQSMSFP
jgi:hypothetical protein